jgi:hypothetical protein
MVRSFMSATANQTNDKPTMADVLLSVTRKCNAKDRPASRL